VFDHQQTRRDHLDNEAQRWEPPGLSSRCRRDRILPPASSQTLHEIGRGGVRVFLGHDQPSHRPDLNCGFRGHLINASKRTMSVSVSATAAKIN
jgi:hypothetical protein